MNYVLAIFLPTFSIMLTGRVMAGIILTCAWLPLAIFTGGFAHLIFILIAWAMVHESRKGADWQKQLDAMSASARAQNEFNKTRRP